MSRAKSRVVFIPGAVLVQACAVAAELSAPTRVPAAAFGTVAVYKPAQSEPDSVALFVSADGGWNSSAVNMVRSVTGKGAIVVGIDMRQLRARMARSKASCQPLAVEFELLSHQIQKQMGLPEYHVPVLLGFGSGATVLYATRAGSHRNFCGRHYLGLLPRAGPCRRHALRDSAAAIYARQKWRSRI